MDKETLKNKIELAKKLAEGEEFEKEVFISVLTAELLREDPKVITQIKPKLVQKELSLKEFLLSKDVKSDNDRTLAIGFFLENNRKLESFAKKDIEEGYHESKEQLPKNISDTIQKNVKRGMMMSAKSKKGGKDAWVVTSLGEKFVENNFQKINHE